MSLSSSDKNCRTEHDLLGERSIPEDAYWGVHTLRAMENFRLTSHRVPPPLIRGIAQVKKACCLANMELGYLDRRLGAAVSAACDDVLSGSLDGQFPLDALQGGAGTSTNMNVNEVLANRALELLGHRRGDYGLIHPIAHVNLHQSTNDVYPTALKIAAISGLRRLSDAAAGLQGVFQHKEKEFAHIVAIGRTELQNAAPITMGAQFGTFAEAIARDRWRTFKCEERLRVVNIGGTAVGTGLTAPQSYIFLVIEKLREVTGMGLSRAENLMDQTANADAFAEVAGILGAHAVNIRKIANDLRLLHFLGEISLPPVQAGSSVMPGKVNPVIIEAAISASIKVKANVGVVLETASLGTLQLNEFLPLLAWGLLESLDILAATDSMLAGHVGGIVANEELCARNAAESPTLITAFLPHIGYERAEELVLDHRASGGRDFRRFLEEKLGGELVARVLSPSNLISLGHRAPRAPESE